MYSRAKSRSRKPSEVHAAVCNFCARRHITQQEIHPRKDLERDQSKGNPLSTMSLFNQLSVA